VFFNREVGESTFLTTKIAKYRETGGIGIQVDRFGGNYAPFDFG
jgi:hypothetical protein